MEKESQFNEQEQGQQEEDLDKMGIIDFEFKGKPEILQVHIFKSNNFLGEPTESEDSFSFRYWTISFFVLIFQHEYYSY